MRQLLLFTSILATGCNQDGLLGQAVDAAEPHDAQVVGDSGSTCVAVLTPEEGGPALRHPCGVSIALDPAILQGGFTDDTGEYPLLRFWLIPQSGTFTAPSTIRGTAMTLASFLYAGIMEPSTPEASYGDWPPLGDEVTLNLTSLVLATPPRDGGDASHGSLDMTLHRFNAPWSRLLVHVDF